MFGQDTRIFLQRRIGRRLGSKSAGGAEPWNTLYSYMASTSMQHTLHCSGKKFPGPNPHTRLHGDHTTGDHQGQWRKPPDTRGHRTRSWGTPRPGLTPGLKQNWEAQWRRKTAGWKTGGWKPTGGTCRGSSANKSGCPRVGLPSVSAAAEKAGTGRGKSLVPEPATRMSQTPGVASGPYQKGLGRPGAACWRPPPKT